MNHKQIQAYMDCAHTFGNMSHCEKKKVGAVIVKDNLMISYGYNGTLPDEDNCCEEDGKTTKHVIHAEENALMKAAKTSVSTEGSTVILTLSPCYHCALLLVQAGIKEVFYKETHKTTDGISLLEKHGVAISQFLVDDDIEVIQYQPAMFTLDDVVNHMDKDVLLTGEEKEWLTLLMKIRNRSDDEEIHCPKRLYDMYNHETGLDNDYMMDYIENYLLMMLDARMITGVLDRMEWLDLNLDRILDELREKTSIVVYHRFL